MKRLWSIIPQRYRHRTIWVAVTIFLRALLNFVGIATLIPILVLILDRNATSTNPYIAKLYTLLNPSSYAQFVVAVCAAIVGIIVLKNIATLLLYRTERNYIYGLYKHLSESLYLTYHNHGYSFVKSQNSAVLTRNVNVVSLMFVAGVLKPLATIISEALLFVLIMGAIAWYTPTVALLATAIFLPIVAIFYLVMRRRLNDIGELENTAQRLKSRIVAESFRGYADIEIGGAFPQMFSRFDSVINDIVKLRKRNATIGQLPQLFTEVGLAIGLATLVILSLGYSSEHMALVFGIFAVAAIRLIPSIRGIMSSWSTIRYNLYTIDTMSDAKADNITLPTHEVERINFRSTIELRNISYTFSDAAEPTIENLSLTIKQGERIGIQGSSGIGKTTLFNLMLGLYSPTAGAIYVDGVKLDNSNLRKWQNSIGYVSQSVFITEGTIAENIAFGEQADNIDYSRISKAIEQSDLKEFIASLDKGANTRIGEQGSRLSGGQRQRIGIARALYKGCDILLFDEATSSLDNTSEQNINRAIERLSAENNALTIVVIAHRDSSLEYCDRIITLGK
ncbi:MAG: ATP-binding cassette domain-containing protein [Alistipes sp.]|nr:ATP-binding cassette domain-containing protein [Alistipes sp.]